MSGGLHSLATIIKRLEAATSRLEDLAVAQVGSGPRQDDQLRDEPNPNAPAAPIPPPAAPAAAPVMETPASVTAFDDNVIEGKFKPFLALTKSLGAPPVVEQVEIVGTLFTSVRGIILQASACKKPDQAGFQALLKPLGDGFQAIEKIKNDNFKARDLANHFSTIGEGVPAVLWITVENKPAPYIQETSNAVKFYGDRIIKEYKEKEPKHVEWVRAWFALLEEMRTYILEFHTTGLTWNPKGVPVTEYKSASAGAPPPPPPPGPPPPPPPPAPAASSAPAGGIGAVFADLNRGEDVTKTLRKVDKSEMTHKNPALRAGSTVPDAAPAPSAKRPLLPKKPTKPMSLQGKKPAKFALEGNKWLIEYQENESALTIENAELSQTVNLFGCKNTTVIIKGKCNAVTLVSCTKTSVLVESVISSISVTSSPSFALQITGAAPTIQLDSTDSGQIYLSKECAAVTEIITAKCSAINVSLPVEGEDEGVFEERAVPEMLKTKVEGGQLVTRVVEHTG